MSQSGSSKPQYQRIMLHYAVAILAVIAAAVAGRLLFDLLQTSPFLVLFICAVLLTAWLGGAGPGLLATGLSIVALIYYFIPPIHSFSVAGEELPRLIFFSVAALFAVFVCEAQRRTAESLRRARDDLKASNAELEALNRSLQAENAERVRAERALQRSETYLTEAQRLSHTGSFSWRINSDDHYWSKETYAITGFDEAVQPTIDLTMERIHPDDRLLVQEQLSRAFRGERHSDYEHRFLMPDGTVKYVHVRAHRHEYESGETEVVGALMDITAEREAGEALQNTQAELAHVTRVTTLGEMSASIAHEVNQPLAAIKSNAEATLRWLGREVPDLDEARAATGGIIKNAQRATEVIDRIRNFSKKADPRIAEVDINEVVAEAVKLVEHEGLRHGVTTQLQLSSDLPPVRGDRIQLQQVIVNLAVNGMEAMTSVNGRRRALIVRTQRNQSDQAVVAIEDAGVGIEPDNIKQIFNAFHSTKPHGLGMGLSICRSIVEAHRGQIWASPNVGPGMTFQFTLPVCSQGQ